MKACSWTIVALAAGCLMGACQSDEEMTAESATARPEAEDSAPETPTGAQSEGESTMDPANPQPESSSASPPERPPRMDGAAVDAADQPTAGASAGAELDGAEPAQQAPGMDAPSQPGASGELPAAPSMMDVEPVVTVIADADLHTPTDLEFNPYVEDELWVMNYEDSSATIVSGAGGEAHTIEHRRDVEGPRHFMPSPTAFAFGGRETTLSDADGKMVEGTFATCPGVDRPFMGPTLWPSDLRIFAISKPDREPPFNGRDTGLEGPGSHLDMLHRTPACTGIAWEGSGNIYWSYSGSQKMFVKYDFAEDHGIGNIDHTDGSVWRYPVEGVGYLPSVPGHLTYDPAGKLVYMADPANGRVVVFDPATAGDERDMGPRQNVDSLDIAKDMGGGELKELVPSSYGLVLPSGLEIHKQAIYVSDHETSIIHKFSLDGSPLGKVELSDEVERSGLAGLAFGPDNKLYFVDMIGERVLRLDSDF
ncbi:MAG: hypothetical protein OXU20_40235 [Myxococcales bacterium]|nr:hypothetical protein [Myxococcales bacterium]